MPQSAPGGSAGANEASERLAPGTRGAADNADQARTCRARGTGGPRKDGAGQGGPGAGGAGEGGPGAAGEGETRTAGEGGARPPEPSEGQETASKRPWWRRCLG